MRYSAEYDRNYNNWYEYKNKKDTIRKGKFQVEVFWVVTLCNVQGDDGGSKVL
jgi:hypothetical protein